MKRIIQTNELKSGQDTGILVSGNEKIAYSEDFELIDFDGNDLITLNAANELVGDASLGPFRIDFDWTVAPATSIDMTFGDLPQYGNDPRIEVWLTIDEDTEELYNAGRVRKTFTDGIIQTVSFPDMDLEFAEVKTGYFLIAK